jgi:hypothetical protein
VVARLRASALRASPAGRPKRTPRVRFCSIGQTGRKNSIQRADPNVSGGEDTPIRGPNLGQRWVCADTRGPGTRPPLVHLSSTRVSIRLLQHDASARVSASRRLESERVRFGRPALRGRVQCLPRHQRRRGMPIGLPRAGIHGGRWTPGHWPL